MISKVGRTGKVLGLIAIIILFLPSFSWAGSQTDSDMTQSIWGGAAVVIFIFYSLLVRNGDV